MIFCFLGFHNWSNWEYRYISANYYDYEEWFERKCKYCGKTQQKSVNDLDD